MARLLRTLLAAALLGGAASAAEPGAEPWKAPMFAAIWLQGGVFLPAELPGAHVQEQVGVGMALRPLPFASAFVEGGWVSRDFRSNGGGTGRETLFSRGILLGAKVHHRLGGLEASLLAAASLWKSEAELVGINPLGFRTATSAYSTGLAIGVGVDWLATDAFAVGLEWRWHQARADFGGDRRDLGGQSLGLATRLYWP